MESVDHLPARQGREERILSVICCMAQERLSGDSQESIALLKHLGAWRISGFRKFSGAAVAAVSPKAKGLSFSNSFRGLQDLSDTLVSGRPVLLAFFLPGIPCAG